MTFCVIYLRTILQEELKISIHKINLKKFTFEITATYPRANELIVIC